jgi:hypothetical protein
MSFLILLVHCHRRYLDQATKLRDSDGHVIMQSLTKFHGGKTIFGFLAVRALGCIGLLAIALLLELRVVLNLNALGFIRGMIPFNVCSLFSSLYSKSLIMFV